MAVPGFREDGWLPVGPHALTWEELVAVFGGRPETRRGQITERLLLWRDRAREHQITGRLLLNGSFISTKQEPGDFDAIFVGDEGIEAILIQDTEAQLLLNYQVCKEIYGGDLLFFSAAAARKYPKDKQPKGLVELRV